MGNTSNNNSRKKNLPATRNSAKPVGTSSSRTRKYVDKDGWTVIETVSPNCKTVIRYNSAKDQMTMVINTESIYTGRYNPRYLKILEEQVDLMDAQLDWMDRRLDLFDRQMDKQMDELDKWLDSELFGNPVFDPFPTYTNPRYPSNRYEEKLKNSGKSNNSGSGCGLGCLFWSVLAFLVVCFVIFGMGAIGKVIIDALASMF